MRSLSGGSKAAIIALEQTLLLQEIPIGTLCLVQAVRQQYSSIGAACSADMAPHKLRMTNRVESICRMVQLPPILTRGIGF